MATSEQYSSGSPDHGKEDWALIDIEEFDALSIEIRPEIQVKQKYPAKLHARSVAKRLGVKEGLIYLPSQPSANWEDSDMAAAFRQRRYFYYLSGINFPDCIVTYDIKKDKLYFWIPPPATGRSVIYNGSPPTRQEVESKYECDMVGLTTMLESYLFYYTHHLQGLIYVLRSDQAPKIPPKAHYRNGSITLKHPTFDTALLQPVMDRCRAIKSEYEIAQIRRANDISSKGHTKVLGALSQLKAEAQIEAIFIGHCIASGAKSQAYGVIAGAGENAATLHYMENSALLKGKQLVCLDAGAEWNCYASDITRTFPISGIYSPEALRIYKLVEHIQEECIAMIKPGVLWKEVQLLSDTLALEGLIELGLLANGTPEEILKSGAVGGFYPHGLGHLVGLEVHDVGSVRGSSTLSRMARRLPTRTAIDDPFVLEPNMVVTVEPGIYFSRYGLEEVFLKDPKTARYINTTLLATYYPVGGVRIEDDILVLDGTGADAGRGKGRDWENLTTAPKGEAACRIIREGKGGCAWDV